MLTPNTTRPYRTRERVNKNEVTAALHSCLFPFQDSLLSNFPFPLLVTPTRATIKLKYTIHSTSAQLQVCIPSVVFRKYEGVGAFCRQESKRGANHEWKRETGGGEEKNQHAILVPPTY